MTLQKEKRRETNIAQSSQQSTLDEKSSRLLFVDSLSPIELMVSFTSLPRWYEQKPVEQQLEKATKGGKKTENVPIDHDSFSVVEGKFIIVFKRIQSVSELNYLKRKKHQKN